jgi:hypothetical protein
MPKLKPTLAYLIATDSVIQDSTSNKYSYIGIFQQIKIPKTIGFYYADFAIVGRISNIKIGKISARIEIIGPDKQLLSRAELNGNIDSNEANLRANFNGIKFAQLGTYTYRLIYDGITYGDETVNKIEAIGT